MNNWMRVNKSNPCPQCGKDSWCCVTDDGGAILCMRVQSCRQKILKSGEVGWIHKTGQASDKKAYVPRKKEEVPLLDCDCLMKMWAHKTDPLWVDALSNQLGVTPQSLRDLKVAWSGENQAWAFPMRNGYGSVVGIRLRSEDGSKFAVKGSKQGLFLPYSKPHKTAYIVEGPTDCAAGLSMGLYAIGRPSCGGGVLDLKDGLPRLGVGRLVVIADNDGPGLAGAEALVKIIPMPCCLLTLPTKDIRGFVQSGGTSALLESMVNGTRWQNC